MANMETTQQLLRRLLGRRASALVQVRAVSGESEFQVVLLKAGDRQGDRGLWAAVARGGSFDFERLIKSSTPVLVKAQDGPRNLSFVSCVLARHKPLLGGNRVLLAWPASIKVQERRRSSREPVHASAPISIVLLRGADGTFPPANVSVKVVDLSMQGACVICRACPALQPAVDQALQVQWKLDGVEHRVGGRYRGIENLPTGQLRLRIEFKSDTLSPATASELARLLEDLRSRRVLQQLNSTFGNVAG